MRNVAALIGLMLIAPLLLALTVGDTVTPGRVVDGNLVSDAEVEPVIPITGNIHGTGSTTIAWTQITTDANGDPITVHNYELRYRVVGDPLYTLVVVPPEFTGHAVTLATGNYEGYVEAVDTNGYTSTAGTFTFTIN